MRVLASRLSRVQVRRILVALFMLLAAASLAVFLLRWLLARPPRSVSMLAENVASFTLIASSESRALSGDQPSPTTPLLASGEGELGFHLESISAPGGLAISATGIRQIAVYDYSECPPPQAILIPEYTTTAPDDAHQVNFRVLPVPGCQSWQDAEPEFELIPSEDRFLIKGMEDGDLTLWQSAHTQYRFDSGSPDAHAVYLHFLLSKPESPPARLFETRGSAFYVPPSLVGQPIELDPNVLGLRDYFNVQDSLTRLLVFLPGRDPSPSKSWLRLLSYPRDESFRMTVAGAKELICNGQARPISSLVDVEFAVAGGAEGTWSEIAVEWTAGDLRIFSVGRSEHTVFGSQVIVMNPVGMLQVGGEQSELKGRGRILVDSVGERPLGVTVYDSPEGMTSTLELQTTSEEVSLDDRTLLSTRWESLGGAVQTAILGGAGVALGLLWRTLRDRFKSFVLSESP